LHHQPDANIIFADMPRRMHQQLLQSGVRYYLRNGSFEGDLDEPLTGRFVCSWSTTEKDMEELSAVVKKLIY